MKLDNLYTRALVAELGFLQEGARIEKVHQPTQYEVILNLRTMSGNKKLLLSIHPETFRFHFTTRTFENPLQPKQFCLALRKHIESGRISKIEQIGTDRHIKITVQTYNTVGDPVERFLYLELMGRHSNLILTDEADMIIDALKRVDISRNEYREILPKLPYVMPQQGVLQEQSGFSYYLQPLLKQWLEATGYEPSVLAIHALTPKGFYYRFSGTSKYFISFIDIASILENETYELITYETLSEAFDVYFYDITTGQQLQEKVSSLLQFVQKHYKKNIKKKAKLLHDLEVAEDYEKYQEYGNLILAHQNTLEDHIESATVVNYFSPEQENRTIPLDKKLTIAENAKKYFKRYTKSKTAIIKVQEQIELTNEEIAYFETISQALEQADLEIAEEIREELIQGGYLKKKKRQTTKVRKPKYHVFMKDDIRILVGKNNLQNDYITMKERRKDYTWLHVKDFPGSHVLICAKEVSEDIIHAAALLAAYYSKMRTSENVAVDYTFVQHVHKPSGAKPGFVIYKQQRTLFVTPTRTALQSYFPDVQF